MVYHVAYNFDFVFQSCEYLNKQMCLRLKLSPWLCLNLISYI